ncbi:MAG TPA: isoprenylcysteine carboxylmethyltransferase family protein [Chloroflexota bacterium]|nr:isoprenylcysteine carboxylmethyltransferase family protein [Chloroflexota bacterium]
MARAWDQARAGGALALARRRLRATPFRTFVLYPAALVAVETLLRRGPPAVDPRGLPLMAWGYLQYRWCGSYRRPRGGGGPGPDVPPERLVESGPYALVRNPMYLGHLLYLTGLAVTLRSPRGALLVLVVAAWFHQRVLADEAQLHALFGEEYATYTRRVARWLPGIC